MSTKTIAIGTKLPLIVGIAILSVLSYRSLGCGVPPDLGKKIYPPLDKGTDNRIKTDLHKQTYLPKKAVELDWKDTGLEGNSFHISKWQNGLWVWVGQDGKLQEGQITFKEANGAANVRTKLNPATPGKTIDVIGHKTSLLRIFEAKDSHALQAAMSQEEGKIEWFTMQSFPKEEQDPPKEITFLGETPLFFGKQKMYSINPKQKKPTSFTLPFKMYNGTEHMKCSDSFCLSLFQSSFPVLFKGNWKWDTVPGQIYWQALAPPTNPYKDETTEQKKNEQLAYGRLEQKMAPYLRNTFDVDQKKITFHLRNRDLFWTCELGRVGIQYKKNVTDIRGVKWAGLDLLLLTPDKLKVQYHAGRLAINLPKMGAKTLELHKMTYLNGLLFLEVSPELGTKHKLFVAKYKTLPGYALCK